MARKNSEAIANNQEAASTQEVKTDTVRRVRVSQRDVPGYSLDEALRIPRTLGENYAFHPTRPLDLAVAMGVQPTTGPFRMLTGASMAYGLTEGGPNAETIKVLPLARRILEPSVPGDDIVAKREALFQPRVPREFLQKYDGARLPRDEIAKNVLLNLGVPKDAVDRTFKLVIDGARAVGVLQDIKGAVYVNLRGTTPAMQSQAASGQADEEPDDDSYDAETADRELPTMLRVVPPPDQAKLDDPKVDNRRVFITHGKNKTFVDTIKELLAFGEMQPVVSVEHETVSQPVPDKVISDMRACGAAIIHVDVEQRLMDAESNVQMIPNPNVLIEIGAAMALYGRRFILLVRQGIKLPSNLQGLYEVRYAGDTLDAGETIKLLKAIKDIKNHPLPTPTAG